jgi:2',3'-cyclic-nucleotide 2'-phosphodiesterase (5'-nucleotidase family)
MPDLTILHTNDFHGRLTDGMADIISREKASASPCLLLDCGDAIATGNISFKPGGEPVLARMSDIGYDAMAMGNREFHFLAGAMRCKLKSAEFPVLVSNIRSQGALPEEISPYAAFNFNGLRVTVFGLCVPMITKRMLASKVSPFWFSNPVETAAEIVPGLRGSADILIALDHIGLSKDVELAETVPGIDLIIGGHTHAVLSEPKFVGGTAIVQAGSWGHYLGKVEITLPSTPGGRMRIQGGLFDLNT